MTFPVRATPSARGYVDSVRAALRDGDINLDRWAVNVNRHVAEIRAWVAAPADEAWEPALWHAALLTTLPGVASPSAVAASEAPPSGFYNNLDRLWLSASWELAGRPLSLPRFAALNRLFRLQRGYGEEPDWYDRPTKWHGGLTPRELETKGLQARVVDDLVLLASHSG